jgi:RNA polymerase sigma factor (sigma-70 family)
VEELRSLVVHAQAGDLDAYGKIVRRFQDMAYGCSYSILGDLNLAQDTAQEAFIEAYRDLAKLRHPVAFPGWFRRIVFKHCDRLTRGKRLLTVPLEAAAGVPSAEPGPDEVAEEREIKDRVLEAIRALPENERMATTLFYINGYSQKEIAEFLDVPVTTVKNRLYTSRKRLKERMVEMVDKTLKSFPLPGDFADVVVREVTSEEDLEGAAKFLAPGYHGKREPGNFQTIDSAQGANIYVVGEEGQVESAGYFDETVLSIGSTVLKAIRPREMAGEAEGVPSPVFVRGFQGCFKLAKEQGISLGVVHGSQYDHAFCGFVPCFYYPVVTLSCERARSIVTHATITKVNKEQEQVARQAWLLDPYAIKISAYIGDGFPHVVRQDGRIVGYVSVDRNFVPADHYGMPFGHVCDVTVQTRDAALAVIRLAGELAEKIGDEEICLMQSHMMLITQTILSLGGKYLLRGSCDLVGLDAEMVAIVDFVALSQNLQGEFQSRLNASPAHHTDGAFSIEMSGATVSFVVNSGRVGIVTKKQKTHRILPRWVVTRLYVGYYSGEDVLALGPVPYDRRDGKTPDNPDLDIKELHLPEKEAALFKALFPKLWPCSMPDPDVWPWVIGKEHPRYQNEDKKTLQMKAQIDALRFPWIGY